MEAKGGSWRQMGRVSALAASAAWAAAVQGGTTDLRVGRACLPSHAFGIRREGSELTVVTMRATSLWSMVTQKGGWYRAF